MYYIKYYKQLKKYNEKLTEYISLVDTLEELFNRTQPGAADYNSDKVQGHSISSTFDNYVIKIENVEKQKAKLKMIIDDRYYVLKQIEKDLRESKDEYDRIYVLYFLDKYSYRKISKIVHYSKSQIGNIVDKIMKNLLKL